jgi:hypothetical protein
MGQSFHRRALSKAPTGAVSTSSLAGMASDAEYSGKYSEIVDLLGFSVWRTTYQENQSRRSNEESAVTAEDGTNELPASLMRKSRGCRSASGKACRISGAIEQN